MGKEEQAKEYFNEGFNCCQSVLLPFCEQFGLGKDEAARIACGMGGGMRAGEICGAVSGAAAVLGLKYCPDAAGYHIARPICGGHVSEFQQAFIEEHGNLRCMDLLGCDIRTAEGHERQASGEFKASCTDYVTGAVRILQEMGV